MITLYHRINPNPGFTVIGVTKTNANGQYEFTRQEGIVDTNREWFVRGPGNDPQPHRARARGRAGEPGGQLRRAG